MNIETMIFIIIETIIIGIIILSYLGMKNDKK